MPRHKAARNVPIVGWLSLNLDCKEGRYIQVGNSLLLSRAKDGTEENRFIQLSPSTRMLYLCMAMEAGGRREFEFPLRAAKKYGINNSTLRRGVDELIRDGFLERDSGWNTRTENKFRFVFGWKGAG